MDKSRPLALHDEVRIISFPELMELKVALGTVGQILNIAKTSPTELFHVKFPDGEVWLGYENLELV